MLVNIWIEKWKYLDSWIGYTTGYVTHNVFCALVRFYLWAYYFFFESNGIFKHNFIFFCMQKCAFCVFNFLWLFHLYSRTVSTNEYLLFTIKESDEKSLCFKLTLCKSSQPELHTLV